MSCRFLPILSCNFCVALITGRQLCRAGAPGSPGAGADGLPAGCSLPHLPALLGHLWPGYPPGCHTDQCHLAEEITSIVRFFLLKVVSLCEELGGEGGAALKAAAQNTAAAGITTFARFIRKPVLIRVAIEISFRKNSAE
jgi:hypothetical protein